MKTLKIIKEWFLLSGMVLLLGVITLLGGACMVTCCLLIALFGMCVEPEVTWKKVLDRYIDKIISIE